MTLKICVPSAVHVFIKAYHSYYFQADLIWCDGTFNDMIGK
jgi:hypothetical protein